VFLLIVFLETVVRYLDVGRDDEAVLWRIEWPEVCAENHDAEGCLHVGVVLLHAFFERVGQILAETHVCNTSEQSRTMRKERSLPVNMRWSLFVYSKPQASFNLEIMLASASSDADTPWMRRLDSFVE